MTKEDKYKELLTKAAGLFSGENDFVANMANGAALLKEEFNFWWVGFYLIKNEQLVLGPFQGPVACTRIDLGKGVCGSSWKQKQTIVVHDVHTFEGHIACSSYSNSEIVVPLLLNNEVIGVLDIDSVDFGTFNEIDKSYLEEFSSLLIQHSIMY